MLTIWLRRPKNTAAPSSSYHVALISDTISMGKVVNKANIMVKQCMYQVAFESKSLHYFSTAFLIYIFVLP